MKIQHLSSGLMTHKLPSATGGSGVGEVDVIVCDLIADDGVEGFGFSCRVSLPISRLRRQMSPGLRIFRSSSRFSMVSPKRIPTEC